MTKAFTGDKEKPKLPSFENLDLKHIESICKAVRVANSRGAFSMEETAALLTSIKVLEMFVDMFKQTLKSDKVEK